MVFHYKLSQISRYTFELELIFILGWHFQEKIAITEPKMLTFYNTESIKNQNKGRFCQIWRVLLALTISNLIGYAKFEVEIQTTLPPSNSTLHREISAGGELF